MQKKNTNKNQSFKKVTRRHTKTKNKNQKMKKQSQIQLKYIAIFIVSGCNTQSQKGDFQSEFYFQREDKEKHLLRAKAGITFYDSSHRGHTSKMCN